MLLSADNATMHAAAARYPLPQDPSLLATGPNVGAWFVEQTGTGFTSTAGHGWVSCEFAQGAASAGVGGLPARLPARSPCALQAASCSWPARTPPPALASRCHPPLLSTRRQFKNESGYAPVSGYYSLDLPGAHIVSLNSYLPWGPDSQQRTWLLQDLAKGGRGGRGGLLASAALPVGGTWCCKRSGRHV